MPSFMRVKSKDPCFQSLHLAQNPSLVAGILLLVLCSHAQQPTSATPAQPLFATVPMFLEDKRVFVELTFRRSDGSPRKARAWVDTGGGWFAITEPLAKELGVTGAAWVGAML
jgi:hypothetical protein